ncbi:uncharacterized protein LOC129783886 [Falco peregrinus]|uniref:uncharacterized protein LOC129783886 n=1 Tax=Falco peregrinus TaxID=8954 RepID=UPI002478F39F|nr:uncharacterized protein LOC129783886 [Falco peregrinus]
MGDPLQLSHLGDTMVPNSLPPQETRTLGDPQPCSESSPSPWDPQATPSLLPSWMELQSELCLVWLVPLDSLLVTLQRILSTRQRESEARASSQSWQGQSGGCSVAPMTSNSSQTESPARSCPLAGREMTLTQPWWPHATAVIYPKPPPRDVPHTMPKSSHRCVRHPVPPQPPAQLVAAWQGSLPLQPPPSLARGWCEGLSPSAPRSWLFPPQPSPPRRDKGTQTKLQTTESCLCAPCPLRGPALSPPKVVPRDIPSRAVPKLDHSSGWWLLLHAGSWASPHPTSLLTGQQPSVTEVVAKSSGGSGKDMAKSVLLGTASPTDLHEAQTETSVSGPSDGEDLSATVFITFMGKSGGPAGRRSVISPSISAGWAPVL